MDCSLFSSSLIFILISFNLKVIINVLHFNPFNSFFIKKKFRFRFALFSDLNITKFSLSLKSKSFDKFILIVNEQLSKDIFLFKFTFREPPIKQ